MPDKDRVSIRLLDCVETEEEEHVEGMKEQLMRLRFIQEDLGIINKAQAREIRSE